MGSTNQSCNSELCKSKICYSVYGEPLFEYSGSVRDALDQYMWDMESQAFDEGCFSELHFAFDLSSSEEPMYIGAFSASCVDLHDSNFSGSDLYWSCFRVCNLENVNFSNCDLRGVAFHQANLKRANFKSANLGFANMGGGADLSGADLTGAIFDETVLVGAVYDSQTVFPVGFDVPKWMIRKNDGESEEDFRERVSPCVREYRNSFSKEEKQHIIENGFPYDLAIQQRFAALVQLHQEKSVEENEVKSNH